MPYCISIYIISKDYNMRLKEHIDSIPSADDLDDLRKGCMPYLKDLKKVYPLTKSNQSMLYRGFQRRRGLFEYIQPRNNRRPVDSSDVWHDALNIGFKKKFGVRARSVGTFCKIMSPTGYGMDSMIFPLGKYQCIWSQVVQDLYFEQPTIIPNLTTIQDLEPNVNGVLSSYKSTTIDKVIKSLGAESKTEVNLICRAYYAVDLSYRDYIMEWIQDEI